MINTRDALMGTMVKTSDYRTLYLKSTDRIGYPAGSPVDLVISNRFNFDGIQSFAMKEFTWLNATPSLSTIPGIIGLMAVQCEELTAYDQKHFAASGSIGSGIVDVVPVGSYTVTSPVPTQATYGPPNLTIHLFSQDNTINQLHFRMLDMEGNLWVNNPAVTNGGEWAMQLMLFTKPDAGRDKAYKMLTHSHGKN
jgi:hypothetical protein